MKKNIKKTIENILMLVLVIFGLFVVYQIIKKALGGSWETEDIIISLLIFNSGCVFTIGLSMAKLKSDHNHLANQFRHLVKDFKIYIKK